MVSHSKQCELAILLFLIFSEVFQDPCSIHGIPHFQLHLMVCTDKNILLSRAMCTIVHSLLPNQSHKGSIIFHFKYFPDWTLLYSILTF